MMRRCKSSDTTFRQVSHGMQIKIVDSTLGHSISTVPAISACAQTRACTAGALTHVPQPVMPVKGQVSRRIGRIGCPVPTRMAQTRTTATCSYSVSTAAAPAPANAAFAPLAGDWGRARTQPTLPPPLSPRTFDSLAVAPLPLATLYCSLHALSNQGCARVPPCSPCALLPKHSAVVRAVIPTIERAPSCNDQAGAALQQAYRGSPPVGSKACACCTQRLIRRWHASHRAATGPHVRRCRSCRRAGGSCCTSDSTVSMSLRTIWACSPGAPAL